MQGTNLSGLFAGNAVSPTDEPWAYNTQSPTATRNPENTVTPLDTTITMGPTQVVTKAPKPTINPTVTKAPTLTQKLIPKVGDVITFGKYEQDNNLSNGKEPIAWRVLEVSGGKTLLLSDKNLDVKPYNTSRDSVTWESCTLRAWLNADFMGSAFTPTEASTIEQTPISNPDNPTFGTAGGATTNDKVFLLSLDEVNDNFTTDQSRYSHSTSYAIAQGATTYNDSDGVWWLRSPGNSNVSATFVDFFGVVHVGGSDVEYIDYAVRPALWMNLTS